MNERPKTIILKCDSNNDLCIALTTQMRLLVLVLALTTQNAMARLLGYYGTWRVPSGGGPWTRVDPERATASSAAPSDAPAADASDSISKTDDVVAANSRVAFVPAPASETKIRATDPAYRLYIQTCMKHPDLYDHLPHPLIVQTVKEWIAEGYTPESIAEVMLGDRTDLVKQT